MNPIAGCNFYRLFTLFKMYEKAIDFRNKQSP
jgi:hypothetical protein